MKLTKFLLFLPVGLVAAVALAYCTKAQQSSLTDTPVESVIERGGGNVCTITVTVNTGAVQLCGTNTSLSGTCGTYNSQPLMGTLSVSAGHTVTFTVVQGSAFLITPVGGGVTPDAGAEVVITTSGGSSATTTVPLGQQKIVPINSACQFG
jgi:hypothetical protein